jgi:hypothetical protein
LARKGARLALVRRIGRDDGGAASAMSCSASSIVLKVS